MKNSVFKLQLILLATLLASLAQASTQQWSKLTYDGLRNRLLVRAPETKTLPVDLYIEYTVAGHGYKPELSAEKRPQITITKGELFRVLGLYKKQEYKGTIEGNGQYGAEATGYSTYYITLIKLDDDGVPTNEVLNLVAKAQGSDELPELEQMSDDLSKYTDLKLQDAKPGDVVMNVYGTGKGANQIPPMSKAVVLSSEKTTRVRFTFTWNYKTKIKLLNCQSNCERTIDYLGYVPLKNWAWRQNPKNVRSIKFLGATVVY